MNFKKATDELMTGVTRAEIAQALGVSPATVAQAKLGLSAKAHRNPPDGWESTLAKVARQKSERLARLAERLAKQSE